MFYLAFAKNDNGFLARMIRWRTNGECHHVEFVLNLEDGQCFSAQLGEGVRYKTITNLTDTEKWDLVPVHGLKKRAVFAECVAMASNKLKYDWRGLLRFFAGKRQTDESRYWCSEVCAHLMQKGGAFLFLKDCGISPEMLKQMALARAERMLLKCAS
jgi:hypothetical protein